MLQLLRRKAGKIDSGPGNGRSRPEDGQERLSVTFADALAHEVPRRTIGQLLRSGCDSRDLIEKAASARKISHTDLLERVAHRLGLVPVSELHVPDVQLVLRTGYSEKVLQSVGVVPQRTSGENNGYLLVVSDPARVSIEEYTRRGIRIGLSMGADVLRAWSGYARPDPPREKIASGRVMDVLKNLLTVAESHGASQVTIGGCSPSAYQFSVRDKLFEGRLKEALLASVSPEVIEKAGQHGLKIRTREGYETDSFVIRRQLDQRAENKLFLAGRLASGVVHDALSIDFDASEVLPGDSAQCSFPDSRGLAQEEGSGVLSSSSFGLEGNEKDDLPHTVPPVRILLVDDDARFAAIARPLLSERGFAVDYCTDGEAALEELDRDIPDLLVCDVHMPKMDGVELLRLVRKRYRELPVLLITSDDDTMLEVELVHLGADAFVRKHEDVRVLLAWCNNLTGAGQELTRLNEGPVWKKQR